MSTKAAPGQFDCFAKLAIDEPYFVIRAKDPIGAHIVRLWAERRATLPGNENNPKLEEARECADAMDAWRNKAMSGKGCGCDPGAAHLCARHSTPEVQQMVKMLKDARANVNEDLWTKLREVLVFAATVEGVIGDLSIEDAKYAIQCKAIEIFAGGTFIGTPTLRRVE